MRTIGKLTSAGVAAALAVAMAPAGAAVAQGGGGARAIWQLRDGQPEENTRARHRYAHIAGPAARPG
jgi:hypothetical protein